MKRILLLTCIGTLALALTAPAAENKSRSAKKARKAATVQKATVGRQARTIGNRAALKSSRNLSAARTRVHQNTRTRSLKSNSIARSRANLNASRNRHITNARVRHVQKTNAHVGNRRDLAVNRQRNINRSRNGNVNRHRNVKVVNHWRGDRFNGRHYAAFRNYHREWHHRDWWRHHYSRIVFVFGAPYYWSTGYWYPAWGYNPGYTYPYDGPIYGYGDLTPDQVIVSVQGQLQRDGYYVGAIDGILGPQTRQAIAAFQADNGLAVTAAIDQPTIATLGLT